MDRNIEFDVTQKACAMALDTKMRNQQSDLCKTTCVGKIFKILEKFENKGDYTDKDERKTRNNFVFMLLKFSGDRSHLVLASMYETPSQVCIFTGERPLTSFVLATHIDDNAPNISCVSLAFSAIRRSDTGLQIGNHYDEKIKEDHYITKFETCFVPTDKNIERLKKNEFTDLTTNDPGYFRNKLLNVGYKKRNYGISYTEDTINDKVLNYLYYIHSSLDVCRFFFYKCF